MKKITSILILLLAVGGQAAAQSPIAQFKFEDAEAAFAERQYKTALLRLNEAEQEFGKINPPILYLRIMTRLELLRASSSMDFDNLESLKEDCLHYLNTFGSLDVLREQAREVYRVSEEANKHPTRLAFAETLISQGKYEEALHHLEIAEKDNDGPSEQVHYLRIVMLHDVVEEEYYEDAERAINLQKEVRAYLERAKENGAATKESHLRKIRQIDANLAGLEDYLKAKHFHNVLNDYEQALTYHRKAAEQGSPMSMAGVGLIHHMGLGVPQDSTMARKWYEDSVAKGANRVGLYGLGILYENGDGVSQDYRAAKDWYEKAAAKGHTDAMYRLGVLYYHGRGVAQSYDAAREWFKKAAEKDHELAEVGLGDVFYYGAQNPGLAKPWYEKAAAKGNANALFLLGWMHFYGQGVEQNYSTARECYEKAATEGFVEAEFGLGEIYFLGKSVPQNHVTAGEWYKKAAAQGHTRAMSQMGYLYNKGLGVERDYAVARERYEQAAAKEDPPAMVHLGVLYHKGQGVDENHVTAKEWYEKAAEKGDVDGMLRLGQIYTSSERRASLGGKLAEKGGLFLLKLSQRGAAQEDPDEEEVVEEEEIDLVERVEPDHARASQWLEKAANLGNVEAMTALADLYVRGGYGLQRNRQTANEWRDKAAAAEGQ